MLTHQRPGLTLLELLCSLAIMGVLLTLVALPASYASDVLGVRAARDAILAAAAATRSLARRHGGAELGIGAGDGLVTIVTRDGAVADTIVRLAGAHHVTVSFDDPRLVAATLPFDALGLGRLANRTITIRRGRVSAGVTFSAYGRARPW